jgi:hypothetical protein
MLPRKGLRALMLHANRPIAFCQTNEHRCCAVILAAREDLLACTDVA